MLTANQQKWLDVTSKRIDSMIASVFPMRDYEWKAIAHMVNDIIEENARGNQEIREHLQKLIAKWEMKERELKKNKKQEETRK